jgi:hypothetical protein
MKKILIILLLMATWAIADVKQATTTTMEFSGALGTMMKLFGAGKPITSVDYYKSDYKRSDSMVKGKLASSQLIDIDKELFISIDHQKKQYSQMTFDEWRQMMKDALANAEQGKTEEKPESDNSVKWNTKIDVKDTGESEEVAGRSSDKVILTLEMEAEATSQEEGKEPETARTNLIVTSTEWLFKGDDQARQEMQDFNKRLAVKLGLAPDEANMQQMMQQVFATYPQMAQAMEKLQKEGDKLSGFPLRVNTLYESKPDAETAQRMKEEKEKQDQKDNQIPTSVGGLMGGLGKKMLQKKTENKEESDRTKLMQSTMEVTELATSALDGSLFEIPVGYKLVKTKEK